MANKNCEHKSCNCPVTGTNRFCSDGCRDLAAASEKAGKCGCDHPDCAAQQARH